MLEDAGNAGSFYIALSTMKWKTNLRWCDLREGEPVRFFGRECGFKLPLFLSKRNFPLRESVKVRYDGFVEVDAYEVIEKGQKCTWKTRVRAPLPALHHYGLRHIEIRGEGNGIRVEEGRKFKDHSNVRDKLDVLRAVIEAVEEPPDIAQSLTRLEVRRPLARPLKDQQIYEPPPPGTGKSTLITTILSEYLPDKRMLVTCVQNKAVFTIVQKLATLCWGCAGSPFPNKRWKPLLHLSSTPLHPHCRY